jgi:hypothetical protein
MDNGIKQIGFFKDFLVMVVQALSTPKKYITITGT